MVPRTLACFAAHENYHRACAAGQSGGANPNSRCRAAGSAVASRKRETRDGYRLCRYFVPTSIEVGPASGSWRMSLNPTSCIHARASAPV